MNRSESKKVPSTLDNTNDREDNHTLDPSVEKMQGPFHFKNMRGSFQARLSFDRESQLWLIELERSRKTLCFHSAYPSLSAAELSLRGLGFQRCGKREGVAS